MTVDELIERVESGEGADRELDGDIAEMFNPDRLVPDLIRGQARLYTTYIDAVVSLVEKKLPGWMWGLDHDGEDYSYADIRRWPEAPLYEASASSPARALLAATLRAMKETSHDG